MADKILIASGKGGVGKSTVAVFLSLAIAGMGKRVLLIDGDMGLGSLPDILSVSEDCTYTWSDVADEVCHLEQALVNVNEKLQLIASPAFFDTDFDSDAIKNIADTLDSEYDYIIIDAAAGVGSSLTRAAKGADRAILVATADVVSVNAAEKAAKAIESMGISKSDMRILINRYKKKDAMRARLLNVDGAIDKTGLMLIGIVAEDKTVPFVSVTNEKPKSKSRFSKGIVRVAKRICGEYVSLVL